MPQNNDLRLVSSQTQEQVDAQRSGVIPELNRSNGRKLVAGLAGMTAVILAMGAFVGHKQDTQINKAAKEQKALQQAEKYIHGLEHDGKTYNVTVPTGGSPDSIVAENEPGAYNGSQALHDAEIREVSEQGPDGVLQAGQQVEVPDVPDGVTAVPNPKNQPNVIVPPSGQ